MCTENFFLRIFGTTMMTMQLENHLKSSDDVKVKEMVEFHSAWFGGRHLSSTPYTMAG